MCLRQHFATLEEKTPNGGFIEYKEYQNFNLIMKPIEQPTLRVTVNEDGTEIYDQLNGTSVKDWRIKMENRINGMIAKLVDRNNCSLQIGGAKEALKIAYQFEELPFCKEILEMKEEKNKLEKEIKIFKQEVRKTATELNNQKRQNNSLYNELCILMDNTDKVLGETTKTMKLDNEKWRKIERWQRLKDDYQSKINMLNEIREIHVRLKLLIEKLST